MPKLKKSAPKKADPDKQILDRYHHHEKMADKHRAHAELISAKLRVQGKRIQHDYEPGGKTKHKIVKESE